MQYMYDDRIVATLDAGGTNFVFSAIKGNKEIIEPITYPASADDLDKCLSTIKEGFHNIIKQLDQKPVAISFAFPGPADYANGIIGDLPNFPSFRGGVALGPMLELEFDIPVFINNDGSLFAYGEAISGALSKVNNELEIAGKKKRYSHLFGVTFGTGFGGGAVVNNELVIGDNSCGGDIWCFRNKKHQDCIAEESVSKRAVSRVYRELTNSNVELTPKDIYDIAEGNKEGNKAAAIKSFEELGEVAGDAIAQAITIIDGVVAIGGGLAGASKYIIPAMVREMNSQFRTIGGDSMPRMQVDAYDITQKVGLEAFLEGEEKTITIPYSNKTMSYNPTRKIAIAVSELGASKAIALGAYAFALNTIDKKQ